MDARSQRRLAAAAGLAIAVVTAAVWWATSSAPPERVSAPGPDGADPGRAPTPGVADAPPAGMASAPPPRPDARAPRHPPAEEVARLSERVLMARLRELGGSDPTAAVQLAREARRRFG